MSQVRHRAAKTVKRDSSQQVDIIGVSGVRTAAALARMQLRESATTALLEQGSTYGIGLCYPPPGILPLGAGCVRAATVCQATGLWVVTGGSDGHGAHLVWMPKPLQVADMGTIEGVTEPARDLVIDKDGILFGAGQDVGGALFSYDTRSSLLASYTMYASEIRRHGVPFKDDGVAALAISPDGRVIAGVGQRQGRVFLYDVARQRIRILPPLPAAPQSISRAIAAGTDGVFYLTGERGELLRVTVTGQVQQMGVCIPSQKGKQYLARAASFAVARAGQLWGGTQEGYLFSYEPQSNRLMNHGRGNEIPDLHRLVETPQGPLYGVTGRHKDLSHLVSFCPRTGNWNDWGLLHYHGQFPWTAFQLGALAVGQDGQLFVGEADRFGHLFIHHPALIPSQPPGM